MDALNTPQGLGAILGITDEEVVRLLTNEDWVTDITSETLRQWGSVGDVPDPVIRALGPGIVIISVFLHDHNMTIEEISEVMDLDEDIEDNVKSIQEMEKEADDLVQQIIGEIHHDVESGRAQEPKLYLIGDVLFKSVGEGEGAEDDAELEILNFFPWYPDEDDLVDGFIEGAAEYFAVRDGFQLEDQVMLPVTDSFLTKLARNVDQESRRFLVTWMIHADDDGRTLVNQFEINIGDHFTVYDASFMALFAEKRHLSGPWFTVAIRSLDKEPERVGTWFCRDGVTLVGKSGEESESLRDLPGIEADDAVGVDTDDYSVMSLPRNVRLLHVDSNL